MSAIGRRGGARAAGLPPGCQTGRHLLDCVEQRRPLSDRRAREDSMTDHDHSPARRDAIKTAAIGLGLPGGLLPAAARAQNATAAPAEPWSSEYWAKKGAVELNLWRKRLGVPQT